MKVSTAIMIALAGLLWACPPTTAGESAGNWQAWLVPASLNKNDQTIRLVGGHVQMLDLMLNANQTVKSRGDAHSITLTLDLPPQMQCLESVGVYKIQKQEMGEAGSRVRAVYHVEVPNSQMVGPNSEWQTQQFFVSVPASVDACQAYIGLTLADGPDVREWKWNLVVQELKPAGRLPKRIKLGLWDYNYGAAQDSGASDGIAAFFAASGVGYTEAGGGQTLTKALQKHGVLTGGNTNHAYFYTDEAPDMDAAGKTGDGGYPSPQDLFELPAGTPVPGVSKLVEFARQGDGIATFDYEPHGLGGFGPRAVARFQKEFGVSEADFQTFRDYLVKNGFEVFKSQDPLIAKTWKQWTAFRTAQAREYMKRLYEGFKAEYPQGRLAMTPNKSVGADSADTLALGCDNAAMALYTDIIMPQLYFGYGGAAVKYTMTMTRRWRSEMDAQRAKSSLWPLVLVRYSGAAPFNTPQRVRQQIVGSLASGADGVVLYFPGMMDAPYWQMLARTAEDAAKYEDFYLDGRRVESAYPLADMPQGLAQMSIWPDYTVSVENPQFAYTAHQLGGKVLLTLFNLEEANDLEFKLKEGGAKMVGSEGVEPTEPGRWLVRPGSIGFVVIDAV